MNELTFYSVRKPPFVIDGLLPPIDGEPFRRLPAEVAEATSKSVASLAQRTAGGRIRFSTDASSITARILLPRIPKDLPHMPLLGAIGLDLYCIDGGKERRVATFRYKSLFDTLWESGSTLPLVGGEMRSYVLYLPNYSDVEDLMLGFPSEAALSAPIDHYRIKDPIVYYGSSITQGCAASRPALAYPAVISRRIGAQFINLGFSGSARGEESICKYIASIPNMSAFVYDYDHNTPNLEHLKATHEPFFKRIREKNPELPIVLVSAPDASVASKRWTARRNVIMRTYLNAYDSGDENVYFVDGLTMMSDDTYSDRTVDVTHPTDLGMQRMAYAIGTVLHEVLAQKAIQAAKEGV